MQINKSSRQQREGVYFLPKRAVVHDGKVEKAREVESNIVKV